VIVKPVREKLARNLGIPAREPRTKRVREPYVDVVRVSDSAVLGRGAHGNHEQGKKDDQFHGFWVFTPPNGRWQAGKGLQKFLGVAPYPRCNPMRRVTVFRCNTQKES
jgi:hypothetical protein